jgi:adenylate kinase
MLKEKGLKLDAVIELKVDEGALLERIEKRIAETKARGEALRSDDNPDVLRRRLLAYRDQTAPLTTYYQLQSVLRSVDGMAPIAGVSRAIDRMLAAAPGKETPAGNARAKKSAAAPSGKSRRPAAKGGKKSAGTGSRAKSTPKRAGRAVAAKPGRKSSKTGAKAPISRTRAGAGASKRAGAGASKRNRQRRLTKRR